MQGMFSLINCTLCRCAIYCLFLYKVLERTTDADQINHLKHKLETVIFKSHQSERHHKRQVQCLENDLATVAKEANRKIKSIRHFWKENIYKEGSRSGIVVNCCANWNANWNEKWTPA